MNFSGIFISRPVATTLLTIGIAFAGALAFLRLSVAPLPQVDFPTLMIQASMSGASPEVMAGTVAAPLERHLGFIADVTEMTSRSSLGSTQITLQFGLNRDIDGAARDVEAAINAARADLPSNLRSNPTYRKYNPSDSPILLMVLTSSTRTSGQLYDSAATVFQQKLSQIEGVGNVDVGGSSLPAVRVELNPDALAHYGIGLEDVRAALASANANSPKGAIEEGSRHFQIYTNDQATHASDYRGLVVAYRNNRATLLSDIAEVNDSVQSLRNAGSINGKSAVTLVIYKQPGANVIQTVDRIKAILPVLKASLPGGTEIIVTGDRTSTIRASLADTEMTLVIAVVLVILVVFLFLRDERAMLIPGVMVPISIIGTFAAMYLLGYSLNNFSLMALTIATGFVVDDAVVVLENVARHMETGRSRLQAALEGTKEVAFTVFSISLSLIGVFLPILLMGGIIGRLFREFTITLSVAVMISLILSLTATPMMCSKLLRRQRTLRTNWFSRITESCFNRMLSFYDRTLRWSLRHSLLIFLVLLGSTALNFYLFNVVPKGFFPQQDSGTLLGGIQADPGISFQLMRKKLEQIQTIVQHDPAVDSVVANTGGRQTNSGNVWVTLKPLQQRDSVAVVTARLREKLAQVSGARLYLQPMQDIHIGGRQSLSQYQFTLQADDTGQVLNWTPKLVEALRKCPELTDLNSDQQQNGLQADLKIDRLTMGRFGLLPSAVDNTLYDAFGERQVSTIYNAMNQYSVVMEVAPEYWQNPETLKKLYVSTSGQVASGTQASNAVSGTVTSNSASSVNSGITANIARNPGSDSARNQATNAIAAAGRSSASSGAAVTTQIESMVPLAAFSHYEFDHAPLSVNHQGLFVASTISFNLVPEYSLGDAVTAIRKTIDQIQMPGALHGTFAGTANAFQSSLKDEPILILAALAAVYVILGILYESYIHPLTILSTLPSATLGALIALILFNMEFSIIAMLGMILLIGIVKKNAIMMVDFALQAEREEQLAPYDAICRASLVRFRPIMMTTFAAILGALPLVIASGAGSEFRRPLGVSIIGGLVISQILTLYTTPVIYLYLDRLRLWPICEIGQVDGLNLVPSLSSDDGGLHVLAKLGPAKAYTCIGLLFLAVACSVGPNYHRPSAPVPTAYKEFKGWKVAAPNDTINRGAWWSIYRDPKLDALERQIDISNQNLKQAEAAFREARAVVREQQSGFFPSLTATPQIERQRSGASPGISAITSYSLEGTATWEPDIWGKIRRSVESSVAGAQLSAAQLAAARLSAQALLATDYFQLRYADSLKDLLDETVKAYQRSLEITQNQYAAGTAARSDVINAQAQVLSAQAAAINVGVQRAQNEHAIALLVGKPPAEVSIQRGSLPQRVPIVPTGVPSALLERRPDIAQAERQMQEENALIGVQMAAYYPTITLSAAFGYIGNPAISLFSTSSQVWSLMASASETLLSGGQRSAAVAAARAAYDQSVANYRETVLAAFQNVEDELASLRILGQQIGVQQAPVEAAQRAVDITLNEYQAGTVAYTTVITAQVTLLADQETALLVREDRLIASVALVQALGGGWDTSQLPSQHELQKLHLIRD